MRQAELAGQALRMELRNEEKFRRFDELFHHGGFEDGLLEAGSCSQDSSQ
jgi:hypothetical protein